LFSTDAEKLSGLIQEWGLKRVNSVTDIIKTQIDIIGKLEQVVISNKAMARQRMTGWLHFVSPSRDGDHTCSCQTTE